MPKAPVVGDTPEFTWMLEFLDRCFPESGERVGADLQMATAMCKAEPKCAQVVMQLLAQDIRQLQTGQLEQKEARLSFLRFALGVLFTVYGGLAYAEGRCNESGIPPEMEVPLNLNPEIMECANALGPLKFADDEKV